MADIIVANVPIEATIEASIDTAMMDAEMNSDSNIELALEVTTWGGSNSRANMDNYLAKDNEMPYEPIGFYNPATKGYVDVNALIHRTGEELFNIQEPITGVVFCTEGYGDYFLEGGVYEYENGELIKVIELSGVGGTTNQSETITPLEVNTAVGQPTILEYDFKSKSSGKGTAKLFINGVLKSSKIISKGVNSFDITEYIKEGSNYFTITITDGSNNVISFDYIVNGVKITVKSSFNEAQVYTGDVVFTYTVIGAGLKTVTFVVDDEEHGTAEIKSSGEQSKYTITGLTHGGHILKVKATTTINEILIESNELVCQILYAEEGVTTPIVSSTFDRSYPFWSRIAYVRSNAVFTDCPWAQIPTYFLTGSSSIGISLIKKLSPIANPLGGNCCVLLLPYKHFVCSLAFLIVAVETTYLGLISVSPSR